MGLLAQWRCGPYGPRTLCNACGVRFKKVAPPSPPGALLQSQTMPAHSLSEGVSMPADQRGLLYQQACQQMC